MKSKDYEKIALDYAGAVVDGEIVACKYVIQACQRQLDDLDREGFDYHFNPPMEDGNGKDYKPGSRVCAFIEKLTHIKGHWARTPIRLEPPQIFWLMCIFGWVDAKGLRRFKTAYLEVPRKNAKSTLLSGVALYMLCADQEGGPEIYSCATTRDQARIVWADAHKMAERNPALCEYYGVDVTANAVSVVAEAGSFRALSRDQGGNLDGLNIHCAVIDELHGHKTRDVWDVVESATGAREQPLIFGITTAGFNRAGICYEQRIYLTKLLDRVAEDDSYWGVIYTIDDGDDWCDPGVWAKTNPLFGVSVQPEDIERKCRKAQQMASATNNFLTKHLNVWVNSGTAWMDMRAWDKCANHDLKITDFLGQDCHLGLDLATKNDIAALNCTFRKIIGGEEHFYSFPFNYLNEEAAEEGGNSQYSGWARSGHLILTDGNVTDHRRIEQDVRDLASSYNVVSCAYDDWQGQYIANNLSDDRMNMVNFKQNVANMHEPMTEWEALVLSGRFHHTGCPAFAWQVSNVICHRNVSDHIYPRKQAYSQRIDQAVAQIMSLGRWITERKKTHAYTTRGFRGFD